MSSNDNVARDFKNKVLLQARIQEFSSEGVQPTGKI